MDERVNVVLFLAAATPDLTNLIGIPAGATGIGIPLYLWLSGKIRLVSDVEKQLKDKDEQIAKTASDRDAWKQAHADEVEARVAAERASAALLDSASLSAKLLEALQQTLSNQTRPANRPARKSIS